MASLSLEPLERGFGTTLGNSLRRVLLSSLPGVAVTSVKIDGIQHEFSTIPGVKEDVTEIILNIKGLDSQALRRWPKTVVCIEAEGECEVTAGAIKADCEVEILDPRYAYCYLGEQAQSSTWRLRWTKAAAMFPPSATSRTLQTAIGVIPVDSIYTPVLKVNYTVENTRVGQITDYDKLTLRGMDRRNHFRKRGGIPGSQGPQRASQPVC